MPDITADNHVKVARINKDKGCHGLRTMRLFFEYLQCAGTASQAIDHAEPAQPVLNKFPKQDRMNERPQQNGKVLCPEFQRRKIRHHPVGDRGEHELHTSTFQTSNSNVW